MAGINGKWQLFFIVANFLLFNGGVHTWFIPRSSTPTKASAQKPWPPFPADNINEGSAGFVGGAIGGDTDTDSSADVRMNKTDGDVHAGAISGGFVRGPGESAINFQTYGNIKGLGGAQANMVMGALGDFSQLQVQSSANSSAGQGIFAKSWGKGAFSSKNKLGWLNINNLGGVNSSAKTKGHAMAKGFGNQGFGNTNIFTGHRNDSIGALSRSMLAVKGFGRAGSITAANADDGPNAAVSALGQGYGQADHVISESSSKAASQNGQGGWSSVKTKAAGKNKTSVSGQVSVKSN